MSLATIFDSQKNKYDAMKVIFDLQNDLNCVVDKNWVELNREWFRAIWIESAELMEHIGWKWWKKQTPNKEQAFMELVDIFHFGVSDIIQKKGLSEEVIIDAVKKMESSILITPIQEVEPSVILSAIEKFSASIITSEKFDLFDFFTLMNMFGFTFEKLFKFYVGKNVLNKFRQDNGYKTGEYSKVWFGKEDNVHLEEILNKLEFNNSVSDAPTIIYNILNDAYVDHLIKDVPI